MSPSACFISDAHLGTRGPGWRQREEALLRFLYRLDADITHLVIVGDLFDFWIEYRNLIRSEYFAVLKALADVRDRGVTLHYVAGNHDFALGPFLSRQMGMQVYTGALEQELLGVRIHVQHGDGILASDRLYRVLRGLLRSRLNQRLYKMLHPTIGIGLADLASKLSRHGSSGRPLRQSLVEQYRAAARKLLTASGARLVVLGHTHTPEICRGPEGDYCNSGEWLHRRTYAILTDGRIRLWECRGQHDAVEIQPTEW